MSTLSVTVVIPTLNGGALLRQTLAALSSQDPAPQALLVIDSRSDDGSDELALAAGAELIRIERREFNHGLTRMVGARRAQTDLVAFLSQDAVPQPGCFGALARAFGDPAVAGATARILPYDDSRPLTARTVLSSRMAGNSPMVCRLGSTRFDDLALPVRRSLCLFDNVASMVRRDVLLAAPFPATMMGEDAMFAEQALRAGHKLVFVPDAVVKHAHEYGPLSAFRRYAADARWLRRQHGLRVRPSVISVLRGIVYEMREDRRFLRSHRPTGALREMLRSPLLRTGQVLGQWWGSHVGSPR